MLRPQVIEEETYIYQEEDDINNIYFLLKGRSCFVLPSYQNVEYIVIAPGDQFGIIDIYGSSVVRDFDFDQWILRKDLL